MDHNDLQPGFTYRDVDLCVTTQLQERRLRSCLIDPNIYDGYVDPTQFCNEAILAATKSGLSINGNVHTTDRIMCSQRVALDQPLVMSGKVTRMEPTARGMLITSEFSFTLSDGTVALQDRTRLDTTEPGRFDRQYDRSYPSTRRT